MMSGKGGHHGGPMHNDFDPRKRPPPPVMFGEDDRRHLKKKNDEEFFVVKREDLGAYTFKDQKKSELKKQYMNDNIAGEFVINGYEGRKNDWHFVKITIVDAEKGVYKWTNKAGVNWTLNKIPGQPHQL